jgi:hypothetical protein
LQKISGKYRRDQKKKEAEKSRAKEKLDKEAIMNRAEKNPKRK